LKYLFCGHFYTTGSGYTTILTHLGLELCKRGHEVLIMGIDWDTQTHYYPFHVAPIGRKWLADTLKFIPDEWGADRTLIAIDIPALNLLHNHFIEQDDKQILWKTEAIFPVENDPLQTSWRDALYPYKNRYVISEYAARICGASDLPVTHLPMGCTVGTPPKTKSAPRELLNWPQDKTIFLAVADNNERKSLPLAMKAFKRLPQKEAVFYLVTRLHQENGWDFTELATRMGIEDRFIPISYGVPQHALSLMYWAADALIVPSQAEGACLPIYEAAAHGLPVICGTWTAMQDVQNEPWVLTTGYDYDYIFPRFNADRWMASVDDIEQRMLDIHLKRVDVDDMREKAFDFAQNRSWSHAVDILEETAP